MISVGPLMAAGKADQEESPPPYVLPYFEVVLLTALGLFALLQPSRRRDRAKVDPSEDRRHKKKAEAA